LGTPGSGFTFDKFQNSHPHCKDLDYRITTKSKSQHPAFVRTVIYASKLKFLLKTANTKQTYNDIYILNTARGGDELLSGPYELTVDCKNKSACGTGKEALKAAGVEEDVKAVTTTEE
jgi:hypothetical protein